MRCDAWTSLGCPCSGLPVAITSHRARNLVKLISSSAKRFIVFMRSVRAGGQHDRSATRHDRPDDSRGLFAIATVGPGGFRASRFRQAWIHLTGIVLCTAQQVTSCDNEQLRRYLSPILLIRPSRSLPPLDFCSGVNPNQAANCRPSGTDADRLPMRQVPSRRRPDAGMVMRRVQHRCHVNKRPDRDRFSRSRTWMSSACCDSVVTILAASIGTSGALPSTDLPRHQQRPLQPLGMSTPNSASRPRIMLISCVRCLTSRSRIRASTAPPAAPAT